MPTSRSSTPSSRSPLGRALVAELAQRGTSSPRVAIGEDTRESRAWIRTALSHGVRDGGGEPVAAGVLPTPALALVTRANHFAAGLMISASHNPFQDNGVKVFDHKGAKLSDADEIELERLLKEAPLAPARHLDAAEDAHHALQEDYLHFLERCLSGTRFDGLKVVLDTAHGAACRLAPEAFRRAGARVLTLGDAPDGRNINLASDYIVAHIFSVILAPL